MRLTLLLSDQIQQQCILSKIPDSACKTFSNATCICNNQQLKDETQECLETACSVSEILTVGRVQADACNTPLRSMKPQLMAPLAIELLGIPAVLLRLYSRWRYTAGYDVDDWIMVACLPIFIVFEVVGHVCSSSPPFLSTEMPTGANPFLTAGQLGFGVDVWMVEPSVFSYALKLFYIDESFYLAVLILTKISILFFYLRIFPQRRFRWTCYGVMAWVATSGIIFIFMQIFQCVPVPFVWEGWLGTFGPHGCLNVNALTYTAAAFSITQDIVILVMPLPLLWNLNTGLRQRVDIGIMFSLGFFILLTSCIRLGFIVKFASTYNPSRDYIGPLIWSGLECGVSMIVTSLPAIRTLLTRRKAPSSSTLGGSTAVKRSGYASQGSSRWARSGLSAKKSTNWSLFSNKGGTQAQNESEVELGDKAPAPESLKTDAGWVSGAGQGQPSFERG
ncbi:SNARE-binding exocyst subunit S6 [Diaporthe australafricana]|uniref:SNARE-binding exocyst subunit S6 n=1 Tax=Diaporthe australafricana TaxID=127596 RepID=A0ABR3WX91_9PEZI